MPLPGPGCLSEGTDGCDIIFPEESQFQCLKYNDISKMFIPLDLGFLPVSIYLSFVCLFVCLVKGRNKLKIGLY